MRESRIQSLPGVLVVASLLAYNSFSIADFAILRNPYLNVAIFATCVVAIVTGVLISKERGLRFRGGFEPHSDRGDAIGAWYLGSLIFVILLNFAYYPSLLFLILQSLSYYGVRLFSKSGQPGYAITLTSMFSSSTYVSELVITQPSLVNAQFLAIYYASWLSFLVVLHLR